MLIFRDSVGLFLLVTAVFSASPSDAEPQESTIAIVEDGLRQYAEVVGKVHGCDHSEDGQIDSLSDRIAAWRYPSLRIPG